MQPHQITLEDQSGSVIVHMLHAEGWKPEKLEIGHTVFIAGLKSISGPSSRVECVWNQRETMAQLVNMTQLPALLTSPCLYQLVPLHKLSESCVEVQVCRVFVKDIKLDQVRQDPNHEHFVNKDFSQGSAYAGGYSGNMVPSIIMTLELYDRHEGVGGVCIALCFDQPATEVLQASAEDFLSWPEDEQALYLCGLQKEEYIVTIYNGSGDRMQDYASQARDTPWRIGQALKWDSSDN